MNGYVVGLGAANVDMRGRSREKINLRDSNPGRFTISAGGVTRNILENAARLGTRAYMLTALGNDPLAGVIERACEAAGVDLSCALRTDLPSSTYTSILDSDGDMFVAVSDMETIHAVTPEWLDTRRDLIRGAAACACDGCLLPDLMDKFVNDTARGVPVFADTVSTFYARTIRQFMGSFHTVKPNRYELAVLADMPTDTETDIMKACDRVLESGCRRVVVSLGADGCYLATAEGDRLRVRHRPVTELANAEGGGDAFMAGLLASFVRGLSQEEAADWALAAGAIAVQAYTTINTDMSESLIHETIKERKL